MYTQDLKFNEADFLFLCFIMSVAVTNTMTTNTACYHYFDSLKSATSLPTISFAPLVKTSTELTTTTTKKPLRL